METTPETTPDRPAPFSEVVGRTGSLVIRRIRVGTLDNAVYLLTCPSTGAQLLVDAADDVAAISRLVADGAADRGSGIATIVTTHRHEDHTRALLEVAKTFRAETVAGADDAAHLPVEPDHVLAHGDTVTVGRVHLEAAHLRGHTPGSVALIHRDPEGTHVITGDSLFPGGVGATTHYDYQSFDQLIEDVERRLFDVLPDDAVVHPGHGEGTTIGAERPHLAEWRERGW